ncbi:hypothetical protein ACPUEX_22550 [Enterobacter vonholyi]
MNKKKQKTMIEEYISKNPQITDFGQGMIFIAEKVKTSGFEEAVNYLRLNMPLLAKNITSGKVNFNQCSAEHRTLAQQIFSELTRQNLTKKFSMYPVSNNTTNKKKRL